MKIKAPNGQKKGHSQWSQAASNQPRRKTVRGLFSYNKLKGFHSARNNKRARCTVVQVFSASKQQAG